jgi:hypothetical protein
VAAQSLAPADIDRLIVEILNVYSGATYLQKDAADMPATSGYVWYAGKSSGKPEIWILRLPQNSDPTPNEQAEMSRQQTQAEILAVLDAGAGGAALQRAYAITPTDVQSRLALAREVAQALRDASVQTVAQSVVDQRWVLTHIPVGTPRSSVSQTIASRHLAGRVTSAGTFVVSFPGQFVPGCSFSTELTFTFDAADRVEKIDTGKPIPDCL